MTEVISLLGYRVKDEVTGYQGIATVRINYLDGTVEYGLQASGAQGTIPPLQFLDSTRLYTHQESGKSLASSASDDPHINLGDEVSDKFKISNLKGICTARFEQLNGLVYFKVQGKQKRNQAPTSEIFHHSRLQKIIRVEKKKKPEVKKAKTAGKSRETGIAVLKPVPKKKNTKKKGKA